MALGCSVCRAAEHPYQRGGGQCKLGGWEVAFVLVTAPGTATVRAWLTDTLVESATLPTSAADVNNFFGFHGVVFNQLTVSVASFDRALLIDNLQTVTAVPEPAAWALLLACAGQRRRRLTGLISTG